MMYIPNVDKVLIALFCFVLIQWDRYMQCDGTTDPTIAAEVNTYINLWHEDTDNNDIDSVIKESKQTLAVSITNSIGLGLSATGFLFPCLGIQ